MLQNPIVNPYFHAEVVKDVGLIMAGESRQLVLQGRLYEQVVPLLDGRSMEAVCQELAKDVPPANVIYTIRSLERRGFVCEKDDSLPAGQAAIWTMQGTKPQDALARLKKTSVGLQGFGIDTAPLARLLTEMGVRLAEGNDPGDVGVVIVDHYLNHDLAAYNKQARESGRSWMLAKPVGGGIWIGPVFQPGENACWQCLAIRLRANVPVLGYLEAEMNGQGLPAIDRIQTPATLAMAWGMIGTAVVDWIGRDESQPIEYENLVRTVDVLSLNSTPHHLIRQPACEECGNLEPPELKPLELVSRKKHYTDDGGHRATTPQETITKYEHHVSPICGAVSMLARSSPVEGDVMHVYTSGNNVARAPENIYHLRVDLRNQSAGKGMTELQAKASALCEGLERYSGIYRGDEPSIWGSLDKLGDKAIHPNNCMLFSDLQFEEREERNKRPSMYGTIPKKFETDREIEWSPAWSLTHQEYRYLPTQFCYFSYPQVCEADFCIDCSNGNAAGNTTEEAILQGFFEIVERDGVALWWYNRLQRPKIDLASFDVPYIDHLQNFLAKHNRNLWALDLTTDVGFPVVAAISQRTEGKNQHLMFGFGAHLDARIAMLRAVTELNQMLVPILDAPADGIPDTINDVDTLDWLKQATLESETYLQPLPGEVRTASDYPVIWTDDIKEDVMFCKSRVESLGMEMLVLNQTRPEIGMPVVKVIVPGMRHFWSRFAPGRLYDAPVRLGWLDKPRQESELNPLPMFL